MTTLKSFLLWLSDRMVCWAERREDPLSWSEAKMLISKLEDK